ncbi:hypothetical protein IFM89_026655 [Coptis chinensis]|uniref:Uncharacterized protein n=1 Tax=Coptis chinensis TaxID=261450 RepID=A0A835H6X6_9MAGN|nr:hypothetical protein IFM89_026655 [Coptis chinensis]
MKKKKEKSKTHWCILVSEEDKEATFVEASKHGRYLLPSFVYEL